MNRPFVFWMTALIFGEFGYLYHKAWIAAAIGIAVVCVLKEGITAGVTWRLWVVSFVFIVVIVVGMWKGSRYSSKRAYGDGIEAGETITVTGNIESVSETTSGVAVILTGNTSNVGKIRVLMEDTASLQLGAKVAVTGTVKAMENGRNPGNFNSKSYYQALGIFLQISDVTKLELVKEANGFKQWLQSIRSSWQNRLEQGCAGDAQAYGVFLSVLTGDRTELESEVKTLFSLASISHLLSISGMHISIIGMGLYRLLRRLFCRGISGVSALGVTILFGIMTGNGVATIRAIVMLWLMLWADWRGRGYDGLTALSIAIMWMLIENPGYCMASGFLLSVAAVAGVFFITPLLMKWNQGHGMVTKIWQLVSVSIGATLGTLPIQLYCYYKVAVYGVLINLIVVPFMSTVLLSGLVCCLSPWLNSILLIPGRWIIAGYIWICKQTVKLPGAVWCVGQPKLWQIAVYYTIGAITILLIRYLGKRKSRKDRKIMPAGFILMLVVLFLRFSSDCEITMVDIGQGDSIVIRSGSQVITIDGGSSSVSDVGTYRMEPYLQSQGIDTIDCAVITHLDSDHYNGITELIEEDYGITIKRLALSPYVKEDEGYEELEALAEAHKIPIVWLSAGDKITAGNLTLQVLYPGVNMEIDDSNARSIVLLADYKNGMWRGLFTGDLELQGEETFLETATVGMVDFLKVGHHGSKNATSEALLDMLKPQVAWISAGINNLYGHPHADTINRLQTYGCKIFGTYDCGALTVKLDETIKYSGYLGLTET
jgi:competence protein ComEC